LATQVLNAAEWLNIPTATFIFSWDNLTVQSRMIPLYDYYLVWNYEMRNELLRIYNKTKEDQVFVTGTPQFDFHFNNKYYWSREKFCKRINADPSRPIVLYSTGMAEHMVGEHLVVEGIANILTEMENYGPPQLVVRVYPKDNTGRFEYLKGKYPNILFPEILWDKETITPKYKDCYLLTNMLRHCSVGINVASTISLELCMFDKPVINIAYNPLFSEKHVLNYADYYNFDHYKPIVQSNALSVVYSEEELRNSLIESLKKPSHLAKNRAKLISNMFGESLNGNTGKKVSDVLLNLSIRGNKCEEIC
jgi:hypothetical protein